MKLAAFLGIFLLFLAGCAVEEPQAGEKTPTPVPTIEDINCGAMRMEIDELLEELNYCETKADCVAVNFDCPFGCWKFVNKNAETEKAQELVQEFTQTCMSCEYACGEKPEAECVNGKCKEA